MFPRAIGLLLHETLLFASVGILIGAFDELVIDFAFAGRLGWRLLTGRGIGSPTLADLLRPVRPTRFAILIPAWDEAAVIAAMLRAALARLRYADYRILVGCYPNDPATIDAVAAVAANDSRVRLIVGAREGPTTKADCLEGLWRALLAEDAASGRATDAVVLHDAEDVVNPHELDVFAALIAEHDVVQLPVLPILDRGAPLVAGVIADEFAETHAKSLVVRELVGAGLPLAGVGCAIRVNMLRRIALHHGAAFDADSLTEDYELGLRIGSLGGRGTLARVAERRGGPVIAVREYFPQTFTPAVRQKARWMIGIALAGWDRTGWARAGAIGDHWMRLRDRRAPLAMLVLGVAYLSLALAALTFVLHAVAGWPLPAFGGRLRLLLGINAWLLMWRLTLRAAFTAHAYGWRAAIWAPARMVVGNFVALAAARRALWTYVSMLRGAPLRWDKTAHLFPADLGANDLRDAAA